jgi:ferric-dicitrate binding protein FerR (iron transport regulator)
MIDLEQKYRQDRLTPKELIELKEIVSSLSDEQLEMNLCESWMSDNIDVTKVETERLDKVKERIDEKIMPKRSSYSIMVKWAQIAAIILLPIFVITTWHLYKENNQLSSEEMLVTTGKGEYANITLPDGTQVALNSESKLRYIPKIYNKKEREIGFDGEGHFQVSKDKERPFLINAEGLKVKVLGTKFNLLARKHNATAELALEEGSVFFSSILTGMNVVLKPNQKAILNQSTGIITVEEIKEIQDVTAWRRKELVFRNVPLSTVVAAIENNYGIKIEVDCKKCLTDLFTGTLTSSDINEDLEILEKSYHFKAKMKNREVFITPSK